MDPLGSGDDIGMRGDNICLIYLGAVICVTQGCDARKKALIRDMMA